MDKPTVGQSYNSIPLSGKKELITGAHNMDESQHYAEWILAHKAYALSFHPYEVLICGGKN